MPSQRFYYTFVVKQTHLDMFHHVNNATYLNLFEEARWALLKQNGYSEKKIRETQIGPTILELKVKFMKELLLGDEITIETQMLSYEKKISVMQQKMHRKNEICCIAEFLMALFDLKKRKLISPTPEWLKAIGWENIQ